MEYEINNKKYQIRVTGETPEIRKMIISLESVIMGGTAIHELKDDLGHLEDIETPKEYNLSDYRIYYAKNSLLCGPNCTQAARPTQFKILTELFELALERYEQPT